MMEKKLFFYPRQSVISSSVKQSNDLNFLQLFFPSKLFFYLSKRGYYHTPFTRPPLYPAGLFFSFFFSPSPGSRTKTVSCVCVGSAGFVGDAS
jgi:hypothetical protein